MYLCAVRPRPLSLYVKAMNHVLVEKHGSSPSVAGTLNNAGWILVFALVWAAPEKEPGMCAKPWVAH